MLIQVNEGESICLLKKRQSFLSTNIFLTKIWNKKTRQYLCTMLKSWGEMPRVASYLLSHPLWHWQNLWWTQTYLLRTFLCLFPSLPCCRPLPAFQIIFLKWICLITGASQSELVVKNLPANAGDIRDGLGRSPGGGHGNPLQYSHLENPMDRGAWWVTVHGVTKSRPWLSN